MIRACPALGRFATRGVCHHVPLDIPLGTMTNGTALDGALAVTPRGHKCDGISSKLSRDDMLRHIGPGHRLTGDPALVINRQFACHTALIVYIVIMYHLHVHSDCSTDVIFTLHNVV